MPERLRRLACELVLAKGFANALWLDQAVVVMGDRRVLLQDLQRCEPMAVDWARCLLPGQCTGAKAMAAASALAELIRNNVALPERSRA